MDTEENNTPNKKVMEEKNTKNGAKKLSYEELERAAGDLHMQYQKLVVEYQKAQQALAEMDFNQTSFFLSMLFKVVEHPEAYTEEFNKWAVENIQGAMIAFAENLKSGAAPAEEKKKDK